MLKGLTKMLLKTGIIILLAVVILLVVTVVFTARRLSFPNGLTLEEEKQWSENNNVWGKLEDFQTEKYTVNGMDDYVLHCELVYCNNPKNSDKYVIISHGYNSNRYGAGKYVPVYTQLGYNCIIYDVRGHGENEKSVCTLGNFEAHDLVKIIDDTYSRFGNNIHLGLHGESMGSSISLSALAYKPELEFVTADCGFTGMYELIGIMFKNNHMGFLEPAVDSSLKLFYGWSMKDTCAINALEDNEVPICFIHGKDDDFITPDNSERMNAAAKGYSELHIVENAGHAQSLAVLGVDDYRDIVESFLRSI